MLLDAGDLLSARSEEQAAENQPRFFYQAASFLYNRIPHPFANRMIAQRLADRWSREGGDSEKSNKANENE